MHCLGRSDKWDSRPGQISQCHRALFAEAGLEEREVVVTPQEMAPEASLSNQHVKPRQKTTSMNGPGRTDQVLCELLQKALRGTVDAKLNLCSEILYKECISRYGEVPGRKATMRTNGRREKEIDA